MGWEDSLLLRPSTWNLTMSEWIISGWVHFALGVAITYVALKKRDWAVAQLKAAWAWVKDQYEALKAKV